MVKNSIVKRIEKIETASTDQRWRVAIHEIFPSLKVNHYRIDGDKILSPEEYAVWVKTLDYDTQLILVELIENQPTIPIMAEVNHVCGQSLVHIQNNADKNVRDLLHELYHSTTDEEVTE